jgi:hypothetical protein
MTARVHDERLRRQQRLDLLEQEESLRATAIRRAAGVLSTTIARSTSAVSAGMRASRAARSARASAVRAAVVRRRRIEIPAMTSS